MTRIINSEGSLNAYNVQGNEVFPNDMYGYKIVAKIWNETCWCAFRGDTSWSDERVWANGEEIPYEAVKNFIKRNTKPKHETGLEGKVGIFILFILGGLVLSLTSLTATGNTISNLTGTTQGLLGLIFFIIGLTGMFFHFKRRNR